MEQAKEQIFIYGAGKIGGQAASLALATGRQLIAWMDANPAHAGEERCGAAIYGLEDFPDDHVSRIIVAVANAYESIRQTLVEHGIAAGRIVRYGAFLFETAQEMAASLPEAGDAVPADTVDVYISLPLGFILGGVEAFCMELYQRLTGMGFSVKFLCLSDAEKPPASLQPDMIFLPEGASFAVHVREAMKFFQQHHGAAIIMNWLEEISLAAAAMQQRCRLRILSIMHSDVEDVYRNNAMLASCIQSFIGVSDAACRHLAEAGIDPAKIHSVTLPLAGTGTLVRSYAQGDAPLRIGYAGRIVKRPKRIDLQLELIRRLEAAGIPYEYHFMGSGTYEDEVRVFIGRENLGSHVFLHPPCARMNIGTFWQQIDVCISTSIWEGRGISILEAMMWGTVPIITETAGAHQDIEDGRDGYIVPIGDVDAMTERVLELAQHRNRLPVMGGNAHDRVRKYGNFEVFDALWRRLLDGAAEIS